MRRDLRNCWGAAVFVDIGRVRADVRSEFRRIDFEVHYRRTRTPKSAVLPRCVASGWLGIRGCAAFRAFSTLRAFSAHTTNSRYQESAGPLAQRIHVIDGAGQAHDSD